VLSLIEMHYVVFYFVTVFVSGGGLQ